ncbi:hypothetical protein U1Q18_042030 [Sarracenia purpurea var. burkii]
MCSWRWSSTALRWFELNLSPPTSIFRWPRLLSSYFPPTWPPSVRLSDFSQNLINSSIVDDVIWSLISAVESVALVSSLCFYFVFCGCTI